MASIERGKQEAPDPFNRQLSLVAAMSAVAAAVMVLPAVQAWLTLVEPMAELFGAASVVLQ